MTNDEIIAEIEEVREELRVFALAHYSAALAERLWKLIVKLNDLQVRLDND